MVFDRFKLIIFFIITVPLILKLPKVPLFLRIDLVLQLFKRHFFDQFSLGFLLIISCLLILPFELDFVQLNAQRLQTNLPEVLIVQLSKFLETD